MIEALLGQLAGLHREVLLCCGHRKPAFTPLPHVPAATLAIAPLARTNWVTNRWASHCNHALTGLTRA